MDRNEYGDGEIEHGLHMEQQAHYIFDMRRAGDLSWTLKLNPLRRKIPNQY